MIKRVVWTVVALFTFAASVPAGAQSTLEGNYVFHVTGMTCGLCSKAIEKTLSGVDGVQKVSIDRNAERVEVTTRADVSAATLEQAIESAGRYEADLLDGQ